MRNHWPEGTNRKFYGTGRLPDYLNLSLTIPDTSDWTPPPEIPAYVFEIFELQRRMNELLSGQMDAMLLQPKKRTP